MVKRPPVAARRPPVEIRPAERSLLPAVAAVIAAGFERSLAADYDVAGRVAFRMYIAERAIAARLDAGALGLVACEAGTVLGYAEVQGSDRHLPGRDHLSLLFVEPARQRSGIARLLLARLTQLLRHLPQPPAQLSVNAAPGAAPAYSRLGFTPTGPERVRDGIRAIPMVLPLLPPAGDRTAARPDDGDKGR
jgi:GNAT superfamily N-acetyltransferase